MATIPHVSPDTLIEAAAQNAFIDEVNTQCAKRTGSTITGTNVYSNSGPAIRFRRTGDNPLFQFEETDGTRIGYLQAIAPTGLMLYSDTGTIKFGMNSVVRAELDGGGGLFIAGSLEALGATLGRADDAAQLWIVDEAGSGVTGHAFIAFHPSGTASSTGTRGGYCGFNGEGLQLQASIGDLTLQSVNGHVQFEPGPAHPNILLGNHSLFGITVSNLADAGVAIYHDSYGTPTSRNMIASTTEVAGGRNLYLRHSGPASADSQKFVEFFNDAGTSLGSITQQGTGIRINGDTRITTLEARIAELESKITTLEARLATS